jgi:hypothetical protein
MMVTQSLAAEIPLYPTGPSEDAAFVRFGNAHEQSVDMHATTSKTTTKLDHSLSATAFYPVRSNLDIVGEFHLNSEKTKFTVNIKPGEFVTVVARSTDNKLSQITFRESPEDFNSLKSSIALYNADPTCLHADLRVAGRSLLLFEAVAVGALQRRSVNPVKLSVELLCDGQAQGTALNLGQLEAGGRYTILIGHSGNESRMHYISDGIAQ